MKLEIRILDDQDQVVAEYKGDPSQPGMWRANSAQKITSTMPAQSDNKNTGTYELFGFTYQPHLRVDRPNGYTAPVPSPNNGQPFGLSAPQVGSLWPASPIPRPAMAPLKISTWGPAQTAPTASPAQGGSPASNLTQRG